MKPILLKSSSYRAEVAQFYVLAVLVQTLKTDLRALLYEKGRAIHFYYKKLNTICNN